MAHRAPDAQVRRWPALLLTTLLVGLAACSSSSPSSSAPSAEPDPDSGAPQGSTAAVGAGGGPTIAATGDLVCAFGLKTPPIQVKNGHEPVCDPRPVAKQVHAGGYDAFLPLGDLQYSYGGYWRYQKYWDRWYGDIKRITQPAAGNHEAYADFTGYVKYFGPAKTHMPARIGQVHIGERVGRVTGYYSYDLGPWHLIALNSQLCMNKMWNLRTGWTSPIRGGGCEPGDPQTRWLERDLAAHADQCTLAYFHHPRFAVAEGGDISKQSHMPLWETMLAGGVDVALASHEHNYQRWGPLDAEGNTDPDGITQFIVGTGGNSHRPLPPQSEWPASLAAANTGSYGVLEMELGDEGATYAFAAAPGEEPFEDRGSITCD